MQAFYDTFAIHELTPKVILASQSLASEPPEAPLRWKHTLKLKLNFHEFTFIDNWALIVEMRRALRTQGKNLRLVDDGGAVILDQTARFLGDDWPEEPNEKNATWFQSLTLTFEYFENLDSARNACRKATFQATGSGTLVTFSAVEKFKFEDDTQRYSAFRSHRQSALTRLTMSGKFLGNPLLDLESRRAALESAVTTARAQLVNGADGRLIFGDTDQVVRVQSFVADVDQAQDAASFSLTVQFTRFPNEAGYAQADFEWVTREAREGKLTGFLRGTIEADSELAANAKLTAIRAAFTGGFTPTDTERARANVDGADGKTFIRLTFNETYEQTADGVLTWELRASDSEETTRGLIRRTYAGFVEASSEASFDSAYQQAVAKARVLGDSKHHLKLGQNLTVMDQQQSADKQGAPLEVIEVSLASTVNVILSPFNELGSIDGAFPNLNALILIKNQSDPRENGIYRRTSATELTRATEADTGVEIEALRVIKVSEGETQAHTFWKLDQEGFIALGATELTYSRAYTPFRARVEFSFEYQLKSAGRIYMEVTSRRSNPTFGLDDEVVSGIIIGATSAAAKDTYAVLKAGYSKIRDVQITENRVFMLRDANPAAFRDASLPAAPLGSVKSPPKAAAWGISVNDGETAATAESTANTLVTPPPALGTDYIRQWMKLEFSFTIHRAKAAGRVAMRYELQVAKDYAANEIQTSINDGAIWAASRAEADLYLDGFLAALNVSGSLTHERRGSTYERYPVQGAGAVPGDGVNGVDTFIGFRFDANYSAPLTTEAQVLECEMDEDIECSGNRLVVQPTCSSDDRLQGANGDCGYHSGTRTLVVSCKATNETAAVAWILKQRLLPLPASVAAGGWDGSFAPKISFRPEFIPRTEGVGRLGKYGGSVDQAANFKCVRATARFTVVYQRLTLV